jgi:hypothetical protein
MHSQIIKTGMDKDMGRGYQVLLTNLKGFCVTHFLTLQTIYDGMPTKLTKSIVNLGCET